MNRLLAIASVALVVAGGALWWNQRSTSEMSVLDLSSTANAQEAAQADLSLVEDETLGNPDAPVTVIEYASFTCPHCRHFHETNFPKLKAEYIDTGKVHFVYREVYFDLFGLWAGMLARCGGSTERYFAMASLLYDSQSDWLASREPAGISDALRKLGLQTGLTDAEFDSCMQDQAKAEALVAMYQKNATADGIEGTPSFVINGKLYSNMAWNDFAEVLDKAAE